MGAANSNLRRVIEDEFAQRAEATGRDWLQLRELLALQLPQSAHSLELSHLGTLFVLDRDKDGRFSMGDIMDMLELGRARARVHQAHEFGAQLAGYCTLQLWRFMSAEGGRAKFVDWLALLLQQTAQVEEFAQYPGHVFLSRDCIETLHDILDVQENQGLDFQAFFDLLQRLAEERGLMDPGDAALDDWLPLEAVRDMAAAVAEGMCTTMAVVCRGGAAAGGRTPTGGAPSIAASA